MLMQREEDLKQNVCFEPTLCRMAAQVHAFKVQIQSVVDQGLHLTGFHFVFQQLQKRLLPCWRHTEGAAFAYLPCLLEEYKLWAPAFLVRQCHDVTGVNRHINDC